MVVDVHKRDIYTIILAAKKNGIITGLSEEYENEILRRTETKSLKEAIQLLDLMRDDKKETRNQ